MSPTLSETMSRTMRHPRMPQIVYSLEGTMLQACACDATGACWTSAPDGPECFGFTAWRIQRGEVEGVDVAGLKLATVVHVPGSLVDGNQRCVSFLEKRADRPQMDAIVRAFTGQLGGPLAAWAELMRDAAGPYRVPMCHDIIDGEGMLRVGTVIEADFVPYGAPQSAITTQPQTKLPVTSGCSEWVVKVTTHKVDVLEHGLVWCFANHTGIQSDWKVEHTA